MSYMTNEQIIAVAYNYPRKLSVGIGVDQHTFNDYSLRKHNVNKNLHKFFDFTAHVYCFHIPRTQTGESARIDLFDTPTFQDAATRQCVATFADNHIHLQLYTALDTAQSKRLLYRLRSLARAKSVTVLDAGLTYEIEIATKKGEPAQMYIDAAQALKSRIQQDADQFLAETQIEVPTQIAMF